MEPLTTRERTLAAALELFSQQGADGVTLERIAEAVGLRAPSLYKHFKGGKREILEVCLREAEEGYEALWQEAERRQGGILRELEITGGLLTAEQVEREAMGWLAPLLDDPGLSARRRLLTLLQYQSPALDRVLWERPLALYGGFFTLLIQQGVLRRGEPQMMAAAFLAPMFQWVGVWDRRPQEREAVREALALHLRQFHRIFAVRERPAQGVGRIFRR